MALRDEIGLVFVAVTALTLLSYCQSSHIKRNLDDIRYRFTSCGAVGREGPTYSKCLQYYTGLNSSLIKQSLLFGVDNREILGAQGFHIPKGGLYNITIRGARGGRGICNPLYGYGYTRAVQVELSTEYELLIFVGQRGTEPCDVIPKTKEAYVTFCQEPPSNITDVKSCNETWYNFTRDFDPLFYEVFGGGGGGGGSLVLSRRKNTTALDESIVVVGGGGGTASILDYDAIQYIGVQSTDLESALSYQEFVNASARTHALNYGSIGTQGYRNASSINRRVAGVGGGYRLRLQNQTVDTPFLDGRALHRGGPGGMDCTQLFIDAGHHIPYSNVYGGFGGGGGACGGGGGGGGYTGGAILASGVTIPGEGGYSYVGDNISNVSESLVHYNDIELDGFVEIILANCGCTYECLMDLAEGLYECLCPDDTILAPDLNDCFTDTEISIINEGSLISLGSATLYYKFIELNSSAFILSNHVDIHSNDEMCVLFWLGDESQIVLTTNVVRHSGKINKLATIKGDAHSVESNIALVSILNSSVLVTGAVLVGTGNCSVPSDTISISASIQPPHIGALKAEEFRKSNMSAVEQEAISLATILFEQANTTKSVSNSGKIAVIVILLILVTAVVIFAVVGYLAYRRKRIRPWSSNYTVLVQKSSRKLKDSLILNAAYSKFSSTSESPFRPLISERDHRYEIFVHDSENDSYATLSPIESSITPLHGVSTPEHDFSEFNVKRRSTLISEFEWGYPRGDLTYMRELGEGQFGKVLLMKAKDIAGYSGQIPVAVKTLTSRDPDVIKKFHEEAELMKTFSHPNIVSLLGFIREERDEDSAPLMILEYMQYGDLASFLKSHSPVDEKPSVIGEENFRTFATDVALGLEFLSSMKYVHRDVAARNCLVGTGLRIKIADFGLARAVHNKDYYKVGGAAVLPVRWMAPESLLYGLFSSASDVWSFGVLLWEIVSYGRTPLDDVSMEDVVNAAQNNALCHTRPPNCSNYLYQLMSDCLKHNCGDRPGFKNIVLYLSNNS